MTHAETVASYVGPSGALEVAGQSLDRLAARVGSTPYFVYERSRVTARVAELRAALPERLSLHYAVKANPMPALVQHLAGWVDGLDVASGLELLTALDTTVAPEHIGFAGPGKTDAELSQAVAAGVLIELESGNEARRVSFAGEALGIRPRVAVRVNPDFALKGSGMRMGGGPQQFGVDAEKVPALLGDLAGLDLDVEGFHIFAGSQNLRAEIIAQAQSDIADLVVSLSEHARSEIRYVNLGGGFGIPYFDKDEPLDLGLVGEQLHKIIDDRLLPALPAVRPVIELGRYLVGEAGLYVTRVVDVKESRGTTYAVVDGGMHHQLAASGNFGQVIRRNYPVAAAARPGVDGPPVTVVGSLCTPLDLLGDKVTMAEPRVGELIAVFQAGAYGLTASPTAFLGHPAPAEILV